MKLRICRWVLIRLRARGDRISQADSVSVKVIKLTDCLKDLTADQKAILSGCGKITKAYIAEIKAEIDGSVEDIPGLSVNDGGAEATVAYAGGKWYIVG